MSIASMGIFCSYPKMSMNWHRCSYSFTLLIDICSTDNESHVQDELIARLRGVNG